MRVDVEWGVVGAAAFAARGDVVVVCDVLSFSTCVSVATVTGVRVWPHAWRDESASRRAAEIGAVLAGARGSDVSLSPVTVGRLAPGTMVLLPSPNGAACCLATQGAAAVVAGCLRNASAVAQWCLGRGVDVGLVAAGEQWPDGTMRPAYEDWVGAGAIAARLGDVGAELGAEAQAAALAARARRPLADVASGVELIESGYADDVTMAEAEDADGVVPLLVEGQFVAAD